MHCNILQDIIAAKRGTGDAFEAKWRLMKESLSWFIVVHGMRQEGMMLL